MTYARRRLGLPLVLLCALAQGVWLGAAWHASSRFAFATGMTSASCACACAGTEKAPASAKMRAGLARLTVDACAFCLLGAVAPEVPVVNLVPPPQYRSIPAFVPSYTSFVGIGIAYQPPGRGPPVA